MTFRRFVNALAIGLVCSATSTALASDHGDTPVLVSAARHDARITDLFAFVRDERLVLGLCLDPTVPSEATEYVFSPDLRLTIFVDHSADVRFDDLADLEEYGGTITAPHELRADVSFHVSFADGEPRLDVRGLPPGAGDDIRLFAGLRDDPFIRGPRIGRNVAALVFDLPLDDARPPGDDVLLIWAISKVPDLPGPFQDLVGRALRSQFPENDEMNAMRPQRHGRALGSQPDVMIFDVSRPAVYPNGRELVDDVVDLVGDTRVLANDAPFPSANDVEFLADFPYLAPPHE